MDRTSEETYSPKEATARFIEHGLSVSRFHRRVNEGSIKKYSPAGKKRGALYSKADVDRICREEGPKQGGETKEVVVSSSNLLFRPIAQKDIGKVYQLQFDEYALSGGGFAYAIQPTSLEVWLREGREVFWVAQDEQNRILATIGVIPLDESIIIGFLKGELTLLEIAITDVQDFKAGTTYACYMIAASDRERPESGNALIRLMEHLLAYWCEQCPSIGIHMLYALTSLPDMHQSSVMILLRTFFFSRRRDIVNDPSKAIWELPLEEPNPSIAISKYQQCLEENKRMLVLDRELEVRARESYTPLSESSLEFRLFGAPLEYRAARTREEIAELVRMSALTFLPPGQKPKSSYDNITNAWFSWHQQNPEVFHVVVCQGKIIGFISLTPLSMELIDRIMQGEKPIDIIKTDDVKPFVPGEALSVYVHNWVVTPEDISREQKSYAGAKMLRELTRMFQGFGERGIEIVALYTRSNQKDGINISEHLGMEHMEVSGVTDKPDSEGGKRVFRLMTATSENQLIVRYRQALAGYKRSSRREAVGNSHK